MRSRIVSASCVLVATTFGQKPVAGASTAANCCPTAAAAPAATIVVSAVSVKLPPVATHFTGFGMMLI